MDIVNFRDKSVNIGKYRRLSTCFGSLPENVRCISLVVVIMTTASGMNPTFSGRRLKMCIISDVYRVNAKIVEVHTDTARSFLKIPVTVPLTYSFTRYANDIRTIIDIYTNVIPYTYDSDIQYDIG